MRITSEPCDRVAHRGLTALTRTSSRTRQADRSTLSRSFFESIHRVPSPARCAYAGVISNTAGWGDQARTRIGTSLRRPIEPDVMVPIIRLSTSLSSSLVARCLRPARRLVRRLLCRLRLLLGQRAMASAFSVPPSDSKRSAASDWVLAARSCTVDACSYAARRRSRFVRSAAVAQTILRFPRQRDSWEVARRGRRDTACRGVIL
jgi:hypothetical protein